jgi:chemotaxis signal transduction protein
MPTRHTPATGPSRNKAGKPGGPSEQVILFRIGEQAFAISANAVKEIRSTDNLAASAIELPQPELRKVRQVVKRGQRSLYVVHGTTLFGLPPARAALVFLLRRSRAALLVGAIERMATISRLIALPRAFCGDERAWYRGLVALDDTVVPVINPDGLLTVGEIELLDAAVAAKAEQDAQDAAGEAPEGAAELAEDEKIGQATG